VKVQRSQISSKDDEFNFERALANHPEFARKDLLGAPNLKAVGVMLKTKQLQKK
jgi:hypothetical protein